MKRAIGYLRVSGLGQVDKDGEARQREAVNAFCAQNGIQLLEHRFEKGVSGTVEGLDRPVFRELLEQAEAGVAVQTEAGPFEDVKPCIVVERLDRLARELMVQEIMLRECRERGIEVYAADQPFLDLASNDVDPSRKLFRQIMGALAEWEKSALVLKLRKARDRKRALTGRCEGMQPFYTTEQGKHVLERISDFRAQGLSVPTIVARLNAQQLKTSTGKQWTKRAVLHLVQKSKGQR